MFFIFLIVVGFTILAGLIPPTKSARDMIVERFPDAKYEYLHLG